MAASAAFAAVAVMMLEAVHLAVAAAAPVTAPAFLWAPENYGSHEAKGVVDYQTMSPASLAKSVLDEGGWSNLVCSREGSYRNVDIAVVFLGLKLQSSDISKDKQIDPSLADTLKLFFTGSEFSRAFPYVALTDDEKLESSLLSGFAENCDNDFRGNHITYTDTCTVGEDLKKHQSMDSIRDLVMSQKRSNPKGKTDLIVFCNGGFKDLDNAKSEGELLSELVSVLKMSGARYTVLYASQPYSLLENPSNLPLSRYLAEKTNTTAKSGLGKCDGECLVKSSLLEGAFVVMGDFQANEGEWAVVGGTGEFAYAQGVITFKKTQLAQATVRELHVRALCLSFSKAPETPCSRTPKQSSVTKIGPWGKISGEVLDVPVTPQRLERVTIRHGVVIDSLAFSFIGQAGGQHTVGPWGGPRGDNKDTIELAPSEIVTEVSGTVGVFGEANAEYNAITSLTTTTNVRTYGPFGEPQSTCFSVPVQDNSSIVGFFVCAGKYVEALGVYVCPPVSN